MSKTLHNVNIGKLNTGGYIGSLILFVTLLVAAPAKADYELFAEWRQEKGASYAPGSEVVTLVELTKGGGTNLNNGTVSWDTPNSAWSVDQVDPNTYWITYNGTDPTAYADFGIALTGTIGGTPIDQPGLIGNSVSFYIDGSWLSPTWFLLEGFGLSNFLGFVPESQSYLNGEKTNSVGGNNARDAMQTFAYLDGPSGFGFADLFLQPEGFGLRINADTRDMTFAIVAVKEPTDVPEPATLAVIGLGLAGLGLARRRRK